MFRQSTKDHHQRSDANAQATPGFKTGGFFFDRLAMFYGNSKSTTYGNNGYLMGYLMMNHGLAIHYGA